MPRKPTPKPEPPPAVAPAAPLLDSDKVDLRMVASAQRKIKAGHEPNREEQAAIRRVQKRKDDEDRVRFLQTVPKRVYEEMSGRPTGTLHKQATTYGLSALRGETIDLYALAKQFHDFLASHPERFRRRDEDENMLAAAGDSPGLRRYQNAKADNEEMTRDERRGRLIQRERVRQMLAPMAATWARHKAELAEKYGGMAAETVDEILDQIKRLAHDLEAQYENDPDAHDEDPTDDAAQSPSPAETETAPRNGRSGSGRPGTAGTPGKPKQARAAAPTQKRAVRRDRPPVRKGKG